jgi:hypothetical protein
MPHATWGEQTRFSESPLLPDPLSAPLLPDPLSADYLTWEDQGEENKFISDPSVGGTAAAYIAGTVRTQRMCKDPATELDKSLHVIFWKLPRQKSLKFTTMPKGK